MEYIANLLGLTPPALAWELVGWAADICFVSAFFLVSTKRVEGDGGVFNGLNLLGAVLYGFYAYHSDTLPVLVLELFWGSIALKALYVLWETSRAKYAT